jgi:hypothetical protein
VLGEADALHFAAPARIEQAKLDFFRVLGEEREVDAFAVPRRAARVMGPFMARLIIVEPR